MREKIFSPPAIVRRDTRRSQEVKKKLEAYQDTLTTDKFDIAELLSEANRNDYAADWGYENFEEYLTETKFDVSPREAYYLIKIVDTARELGIERKKLVAAGVSKLKVIVSKAQGEEVIKLINDAPKVTLVDLKKRFEKNAGDDPDFTWLNVPMKREDKTEYYDEAIRLCRAITGDTINVNTGQPKDLSEGAALAHICQSYLQDANNQAELLGEEGDYTDEVAGGEEA